MEKYPWTVQRYLDGIWVPFLKAETESDARKEAKSASERLRGVRHRVACNATGASFGDWLQPEKQPSAPDSTEFAVELYRDGQWSEVVAWTIEHGAVEPELVRVRSSFAAEMRVVKVLQSKEVGHE
jgi:hypothetical protein